MATLTITFNSPTLTLTAGDSQFTITAPVVEIEGGGTTSTSSEFEAIGSVAVTAGTNKGVTFASALASAPQFLLCWLENSDGTVTWPETNTITSTGFNIVEVRVNATCKYIARYIPA